MKYRNVRRRKLLRNIGAGVTAGLALPLLPSWLSGCKPDDPVPDIRYDGVIAVIGAGTAGLFAADILKSKGLSVKVFEASDRVGGRVRSIRLFDDSPVKTDFPIELGAERIVGTDALMAEIVAQRNIPTIDVSAIATDHFLLEGMYYDEGELLADGDFINARNFVAGLADMAGGAGTVQQAIEAAAISPRMFGILNSLIGNVFGSANDRLGIRGIAEAQAILSRNDDVRILRSNPMEDVLTSRFSAVVSSVQLNSQVKSIDYSGARILLSGSKTVAGGGAENFTEEVDKVIVAIPVSVLKEGDLSFAPALPTGKLSALANLDMDACVRVVLDFKQNFWGAAAGFIYGGTVSPEFFNTGISRSEFSKTLSITAYGAQAETFSDLGPECIPLILEELDEAFEGKATQNIRRDESDNVIFEMMDWSTSPFIRGGVSYVRPGGSHQDRVTLAEGINQQVFFAGEATDVEGDAGTLNGALRSGRRAADEVIASILNA